MFYQPNLLFNFTRNSFSGKRIFQEKCGAEQAIHNTTASARITPVLAYASKVHKGFVVLKSDKVFSYLIGLLITVAAAVIGFRFLDDYARAEDFSLYRLAFNLAEGNGLLYNAGENVLPTTSPLFAVLIGLCTRFLYELTPNFTPNFLDYLATGLVSVAYGLASMVLYRLLRQITLTRRETLSVIVLWLLALPLWLGFRSPAPFTFLLILMALETGLGGQWRAAGFLAGMAVLAQPEGLLACLALGLYALNQERGGNYWKTVCIPGIVWALVAAFLYRDGYLSALALGALVTQGSTLQGIVWIALFVGAVGALHYRNQSDKATNWLWVMALWAALETSARLLVFGKLTQVESLPLALVIAAGVVMAIRWLKSEPQRLIGTFASIAGMAILLIAWFPQTSDDVALDTQLSQHLFLSGGRDFLHDRSDAIISDLSNFDGNLYRLDGKHSPWVDSFVERGDYQSLIIAAAPGFIYFNAENGPLAGFDLRSPALAALHYRKELDLRVDPGQRIGDELWIRRESSPDFGDTHTVNLDFGPDMRLKSYATDHTRMQPGDSVRVRLDWQLTRPPRSEITVLMSLLDINELPIVSIFPVFPAENWQPLHVSTYHVMAVPEDAEPGIVALQVALDYKAAILGRNKLATLVVALPTPAELPAEIDGQIADAILYHAEVTQVEHTLQVALDWGVTRPLNQDYQVLVHLIPVNETAPVAFGDGLPLGGRYPTSYWLPGEIIPDSHVISLENVPPGGYQIFVGFYVLETFERLRDAEKDSLPIAQVTIDAEGNATIQPTTRILG